MIDILVADDHPLIRQGLIKILNSHPDITVCAEADSGQDVLQKIDSHKIDLVLLDISMPGMGGIDTLIEIKKRQPHLPVLMLSVHAEEFYAVRAMKAGASGYVIKSSHPDDLITAIRKCASGGKYITESLAEMLVDSFGTDDSRALHENLSERELRVMISIAQGKRNKTIADELFISPKTVSTYRNRILIKMGMKSNAELTRYTLEHGLILMN